MATATLSKTESASVKRITDEVERARSAQSRWQMEASKLWELRKNMPLTRDQVAQIEARGLPVIKVPLVHQLLAQYKAMLCAETPSYLTVPREDSDVRTARVQSDLLKYIWQQSKGDYHLRRLVEGDYVIGRGWMCAYIDPDANYERGEVYNKYIEWDEVFVSQDAREVDCSDASFIAVARTMTRAMVIQRWPDKKATIMDAAALNEWEGEYTRFRDETQVVRSDITDGGSADRRDEQLKVIEHFRRVRRKRTFVTEVPAPSQKKDYVFDDEDLAAYREERAFRIEVAVSPDPQRPLMPPADGSPPPEEMVVDRFLAISFDDVRYYDGIYAAYLMDEVVTQGQAAWIPDEAAIEQGILQWHVATPVTKGDLLTTGEIESRLVMVDRIGATIIAGDRQLYKYDLETQHYPLVPMMSEHDGTPFPMSDVAQIKSLIEQYNKYQQLKLAWAMSIVGQKYEADMGSVVQGSEDAVFTPGPDFIWKAPGSEPLRPLFPQPIPAHIYQEEERILRALYDVTGIYPDLQGDPSAGGDTFRGDLIRDEKAQRRIRVKEHALGVCLEQLARVTLDLARSVYTRERVLRIIDPSAPTGVRSTTINQLQRDGYGDVVDLLYDVTSAEVDVVFESGSTLPTNRQAEADRYERLFGLFASLGLGELFLPYFLRKQNMPEAEDIIGQIDPLRQRDQMIAQLQEEIKQLQGDMQTKDRELETADRRVADQKYQKALAMKEASVESTSERAKAEIKEATGSRKEIISLLEQIFNETNQAAAPAA